MYLAHPDQVERVEIVANQTAFNVKGRASDFVDVRSAETGDVFPVLRIHVFETELAAAIASASFSE